jgi:2-C-methyl-D-erythritol 4-phosphate cytidylyltransferase
LLIHDAARCLITKELINKVTLSAIKSRSCAILGVPVKDTIKVVETIENENIVKETKNRDSLWQIQTPQVIRKDLYRFCIKKAIKENKIFTDDSQLIENYTDAKVCVVLGEYDNLKLTTREDICIIESLLKKRNHKKI